MATDRLPERITRCVLGLALFGVGISLIIDARIGVPPWDVFHQGVAGRVDRSIGTVLNAIEIGLVANVAIALLPQPESLLAQVPMMLSGVVVVALGSGLYIGSGLGPGPRDGLMTGLAARGVPLRVARTAIEVTVLVVGWCLGGQVGVGTVVFALGIGPLVQVLLPRLAMKSRD